MNCEDVPRNQRSNAIICNFCQDPSKHFPCAQTLLFQNYIIKNLFGERLAWALANGASEERKLLAREEIVLVQDKQTFFF